MGLSVGLGIASCVIPPFTGFCGELVGPWELAVDETGPAFSFDDWQALSSVQKELGSPAPGLPSAVRLPAMNGGAAVPASWMIGARAIGSRVQRFALSEMQLGHQWGAARMDRANRLGIKQIRNLPMSAREVNQCALGKTCREGRQVLSMPKVNPAQKEEIIELSLGPPGGFALVFAP